MQRFDVTYVRKGRTFMTSGLMRSEVIGFMKDHDVINVKNAHNEIVYTKEEGWLN